MASATTPERSQHLFVQREHFCAFDFGPRLQYTRAMKKPNYPTGMEAVEVLARVTQAKLARALTCKENVVHQWKTRGIPLKRLKRVGEVTGLSPRILRPDIAALFDP